VLYNYQTHKLRAYAIITGDSSETLVEIVRGDFALKSQNVKRFEKVEGAARMRVGGCRTVQPVTK
jgi:hypothetical protein